MKFFVVFAVALGVLWVGRTAATGNNEHVRQAWAFLHGHAWVWPAPWEHVEVGMRAYGVHPPGAAVLCMPAVALWGPGADQTGIGIAVGALTVAAVWRMLGAARCRGEATVWLTVFFAMGTPFWFEATQGASWGFALVVSCLPTALALGGLLDGSASMMVGCWAAGAALIRYDLAAVMPVYAVWLWRRDRRVPWGFVWGPLAALVVYVLYAQARFGTWTDGSLWMWYRNDPYRAAAPFGPFSIRYLPWNLYTAIFMAPGFRNGFPWIRPGPIGEALMFTSPGLVLALEAPWREWETWLLWTAVTLGMAACLTVYANGFVQFGCRYWIQVLPFLVLLMARGMRGRTEQLGKVLLVASVVLTVGGTWIVRHYGW